MYYLYLCICTSAKCMSVELKVYLFIWSHNFRFSMSLSLLPNYRLHRRWPFNEGALYIRSSIKFLHFVPFRQQIWPPRAILVSDWLMLKKSSPLKLLGQMEPNLAGSIYVRSSIKLLHLVPFGQQIWPLLLKIEHMVKLHVFGNNSKTINNIRNLTSEKWSAQQDLTTLKFWRKSNYLSWSYCPFFIKFSKF